jgi:outer membrane protein assembly factor BamE (lipoprotein component of BamABCDE complex)
MINFMLFKFKYHYLVSISLFFILIGCQFQEPTNTHGIIFLKNRYNKLEVGVANKNDVINMIGNPHSKSINNDDEWFYIERVLSRGRIHKLGKNVLKDNNVLLLIFNKYGVLEKKELLDVNDRNKISFSEEKTKNELAKKSFIEKFLNSIKTRMYRRNK